MKQVSTAEAARLHGVTSQTIRRWIAAGRLPSVRDNHGNIRVALDVSNDATHVATSATCVASVPPHVADLPELVTELRQRLDAQEARHDAEMVRRLAERDNLHQGHIERLIAQAALERSLWLERIDAAELRAERVEQRLDHVLDELMAERRRPLWRKLFG